MKTILKLASIVTALCLCTACFTTLALTALVLSNITPGTKVRISGKTVREVPSQPQAALLEVDGGGVICIVYDFVGYTDGKQINDKFVRGGVYKYTDKDGAERYAPIFIRAKSYKNLWPIAAQLDVNREEDQSKPEYYTQADQPELITTPVLS